MGVEQDQAVDELRHISDTREPTDGEAPKRMIPPDRKTLVIADVVSGALDRTRPVLADGPSGGPPAIALRQPRRAPNPASRAFNVGDRIFGSVTFTFAALILVVLVGMLFILFNEAQQSITTLGFNFVTSQVWNPSANVFGAAPAILGTLYTSMLALLLAVPIGLLVAVYLVEIAPRRIRFWLGFLVELLAAVPSVVYGLWALVVLVPLVAQNIEPFFIGHFGTIPLFQGIPIGLSVFTASIILAIMVLPTITAISRDVMLAVPNAQRDAMLALGATRWEMIWKAVIPYAKSGIIGAIVLALGRAVGETMAVQMVIGNTLSISPSLFSQGTTITATLVNQFPETTPGLFRSALIEIALILMLVTIVLNIIARVLVWRVSTVD